MSAVTEDLLRDYRGKDPAYYSSARHDYVESLPADPGAKILELGCGNGATGLMALRAGKCGEYIGIELFRPMAEIASTVLTHVHIGDVHQLELPYPEGSFDVLIMSEVLEHLVDPDATLARLVKLLKPGGLVLASSPNISHWPIIRDLVLGRFDYAEAGPMDRTHLRWFTPASFKRMFEAAGVVVDRIEPIEGKRALRWRIINRMLSRRFRHLTTYQINLRGHRASD